MRESRQEIVMRKELLKTHERQLQELSKPVTVWSSDA